jgi:hypothetical protein
MLMSLFMLRVFLSRTAPKASYSTGNFRGAQHQVDAVDTKKGRPLNRDTDAIRLTANATRRTTEDYSQRPAHAAMPLPYCAFFATPWALFDGIAPISALFSIARFCILPGMELVDTATGSPQCVIPAVAALCALPPPEPPFPLPPPCANTVAEPHKNATDTPANIAFRIALFMVFLH